MTFVLRKLDRTPKTLGEKLRALRRGQAVTLDLIEKKTHIQRKYLEALEKGRYEVLPEPLYTRNFIRAYARALGADEYYFIELYEEEVGVCDLVKPMQTPRQKLRGNALFVWNNALKFAGLFLFASLLFTYIGWQVNAILSPPEIVLFSPVDGSVSSSASIDVSGLVEKESTVYVNGEQVIVNTDLTFSSTVNLDKGVNIITIEAERRYSRRSHLNRKIIFDPNSVHASVVHN